MKSTTSIANTGVITLVIFFMSNSIFANDSLYSSKGVTCPEQLKTAMVGDKIAISTPSCGHRHKYCMHSIYSKNADGTCDVSSFEPLPLDGRNDFRKERTSS